ncbi:unnamed protein product [Citrullus colocynthis]|uniref:Uncharacterized protein n=1 Tax=Citrullus colocynthis TaxID=252529 RepID=A0ABP0YD94_9ROSI
MGDFAKVHFCTIFNRILGKKNPLFSFPSPSVNQFHPRHDKQPLLPSLPIADPAARTESGPDSGDPNGNHLPEALQRIVRFATSGEQSGQFSRLRNRMVC